MRLEYRFPNIPELKNLSIMVENKGDIVRTAISGTNSLWVRFLIKFYFGFHNKIGTLARLDGSNVYSMYLPPFPSLAHARMFEVFLSSVLFKRKIPMAVTIGVTTGCQYRCIHCSAKGRSKSRSDLSLDELRRTVQQCLDLGVANITFTGGEPLLRDDLEQLISSVSPDQAISQVFTNALALTSERARSLKDAGIFGVQISLDSADPAEHDRLRGFDGAFRAVEEGVQNALDAGLLVGISTYATRQNTLNHNLIPIADLCAQWGVHEISIFDAIKTGGLSNQEDVTLDKISRKVLRKDSLLVNKKYQKIPRVITQSWTNSGSGFSRFIGCLAANRQFHITAQGDFTPCDFTPLSFGNVRTESVKSLWEKLIRHPAYCQHQLSCRMQDQFFRKQYIDKIPENADLPYAISDL
jgi:MoaA/NifB/PqqE/SkfB family radical SAM enzyme